MGKKGTGATRLVKGTLAGSRGGLRILEWTGKLVPQGLIVKGLLLVLYRLNLANSVFTSSYLLSECSIIICSRGKMSEFSMLGFV